MKRTLLSLAVVVGLSACSAQPTVPVIQYENIITTLPKSYTGHCAMEVPPEQTTYVNATQDQRITMLLGILSGDMVDIKNCNDRWDQVDVWTQKELTLYQNDPTAQFVGQAPVTASSVSAASAPSADAPAK